MDIKKGQKYQVVNKNCFNYGRVLTIVKVVLLSCNDNPDQSTVYYSDKAFKKGQTPLYTSGWWIKAHCELLGTSERKLLRDTTNLAKEYRDKLQKEENRSGYLDNDIDALNNFIDWLEKKRKV